jgi:NADH:ubiquinone oxidoreductase subunit F (NADH-binding)
MRFFEHESCGQCTPCRNGTAKAVGADRRSRSGTWPLLAELSR